MMLYSYGNDLLYSLPRMHRKIHHIARKRKYLQKIEVIDAIRFLSKILNDFCLLLKILINKNLTNYFTTCGIVTIAKN